MVLIRMKYVYKKDDKVLTLIARGQLFFVKVKSEIFNVDYRPGSKKLKFDITLISGSHFK